MKLDRKGGDNKVNELIKDRASKLTEPQPMGSYSPEDCVFLLKDVTGLVKEQSNEEREKAIQSGTHYSEMLPVEYVPNDNYVELFHKILADTEKDMAKYVAIVSELIVKQRGENVVLVSLARAGTPIGVLIKRYIKEQMGLDLPHYSISIIRGKGFDENALAYIINKHNTDNLQFIDGWTGKGMINNVLKEASDDFNRKYQVNLNTDLCVLSDPSQSVPLFGTREDVIIPSSCLNSTVSGLMSRTFQRDDLIGEYDYHGSKYYEEFKDIDLSNHYIETIAKHFSSIQLTEADFPTNTEILNTGMKEVLEIGKIFDLEDVNFVKPGVGETTRVLLRRVPWKILVDDLNNPNLKHMIMLAKDRGVPLEEYKNMNYSCCGLIQVLDQ